MPEQPEPQPIGNTLEAMIHEIAFSDPATHPLRDEWERIQAEERAVFERVCREQYEDRLEYHQICRTPDPEKAARDDERLLRPMLQEELDQRIVERWKIIWRKIGKVLEDRTEEA